jgi:hypothetical protein
VGGRDRKTRKEIYRKKLKKNHETGKRKYGAGPRSEKESMV